MDRNNTFTDITPKEAAMSFSVSSVPSSIRTDVSRLCEFLRTEALNGVVSWSIDPEACFAEFGFVWAAERRFASIAVCVDQRKGKVHKLSIQLPMPEAA